MAREEGFDNINMDIILGLPGEGVSEVADTLRRIRELKPDALTVHSLAIKRASALKQHLDEIGIEALVNTDETMALAADCAHSMGMEPYYLYRQKNMSGNFENTGYSIPGKEGIYNILIMEEVQSIVALGAGAISKRVDYDPINITRTENPKDIDNYITRIDEMITRKKELFSVY
jgi:oxygen-independent coproporphyrinogen-3 oxidase